MEKTVLYDEHARLGARFESYDGWTLPADYGDPIGEWRAVRQRCGVADLSHRSQLRLCGRDHVRFLQGMLTNDVARLAVGGAQYAAMLTPKGKMLADMYLYRWEDSVLLDMEPGMAAPVAERLERFKLTFKVDIVDQSPELATLHVAGPGARPLLEEASGAEAPREGWGKLVLGGVEAVAAPVGRTGEEGFDLFVSSQAAASLWRGLLAAGAAPVGMEAMETLRIEAGVPRYGVDMTEATIPIEAGIEHAISYEKGCYVGQEVVARIHWRGHVNWHLRGLVVESATPPPPGAEVLDEGGKRVGRVTSSTLSPALDKAVALGYIRRERADDGTLLKVDCGGGVARPCRVASPPIVGRGG